MAQRIVLDPALPVDRVEITGLYITYDTTPGIQELKNIFVRGAYGYMDGGLFVPVGCFEHRVDDPTQFDAVMAANIEAGPFGQKLRDFIMQKLLDVGILSGTLE